MEKIRKNWWGNSKTLHCPELGKLTDGPQGTEPNSVDTSTTAVVQYYWLIWLSIHNQQELIAIVPMPLKVEGHL